VSVEGSKKKEGAGEPVGEGKGEGGAAALVVEPEGPRIWISGGFVLPEAMPRERRWWGFGFM